MMMAFEILSEIRDIKTNCNRSWRVHQALSGARLRQRPLAEDEGHSNCEACRQYNLRSGDTLV